MLGLAQLAPLDQRDAVVEFAACLQERIAQSQADRQLLQRDLSRCCGLLYEQIRIGYAFLLGRHLRIVRTARLVPRSHRPAWRARTSSAPPQCAPKLCVPAYVPTCSLWCRAPVAAAPATAVGCRAHPEAFDSAPVAATVPATSSCH